MSEFYCPECGYPLNGNESSCPECGCTFLNYDINDPLTACCYCGHMVAKDATTCPRCGGQITSRSAPGNLRIYMDGSRRRNYHTAPLYINGQLIEAVPLSKGCDITIPINNPNVIVSYRAELTYIEHPFHLDVNKNYTLLIRNGVNTGFTLLDDSDIKIFSDKINFWWVLFNYLFFWLFIPLLLLKIRCRNSRPVLVKCMDTLELYLIGITFAFSLFPFFTDGYDKTVWPRYIGGILFIFLYVYISRILMKK